MPLSHFRLATPWNLFFKNVQEAVTLESKWTRNLNKGHRKPHWLPQRLVASKNKTNRKKNEPHSADFWRAELHNLRFKGSQISVHINLSHSRLVLIAY